MRLRVAAPEPPPWLDAEEGQAPAQPLFAALPSPHEPAVAAAREAAPAPAVDSALGDRWAAVVARLIESGSIAALARELAWQAQCVAVDDAAAPQVWRLRVEREMLRSPAHADRLQAALAELLAQPVRLELLAGPARDTPAERDALLRARRQAEAEQAIHGDPLVRSLMAQYTTARIVPGSVKPH